MVQPNAPNGDAYSPSAIADDVLIAAGAGRRTNNGLRPASHMWRTPDVGPRIGRPDEWAALGPCSERTFALDGRLPRPHFDGLTAFVGL